MCGEIGGTLTRALSPVNDLQNKLYARPFFEWMRSGDLSKEKLKFFAEQYYAASLGFPEIIAAAASAPVSEDTKYVLIENLWDEFGQGERDQFHRNLLKKFLISSGGDVDKIVALPTTKAYIRGMKALCREGSEGEIIGAIGPGCEHFTPAMYVIIVNGLKRAGVYQEADLIFFTAHISHDKEHHIGPINELMKNVGNSNGYDEIVSGAIQAISYENIFWEGLEVALDLH